MSPATNISTTGASTGPLGRMTSLEFTNDGFRVNMEPVDSKYSIAGVGVPHDFDTAKVQAIMDHMIRDGNVHQDLGVTTMAAIGKPELAQSMLEAANENIDKGAIVGSHTAALDAEAPSEGMSRGLDKS